MPVDGGGNIYMYEMRLLAAIHWVAKMDWWLQCQSCVPDKPGVKDERSAPGPRLGPEPHSRTARGPGGCAGNRARGATKLQTSAKHLK